MRGARAAALAAVAMLLTGCDGGPPAALSCKVEVATPELVKDREAAGIAGCQDIRTTGEPVDLPKRHLDCLGEEGSVRLDAIEGPAMINFWASNCGPCRKELPALAEFSRRYGDQVQVVGVDYGETYPGAAIDLARQSGVAYPSLADACGDLADSDLVIPGLPQFVLVAADGSVQQVSGGVDSVDELVAMVRDTLGLDLTAKAAS